MRFTVFDRWGTQIGVVQNVIEAIHKDEVNGEDSLTLIVPESNLIKGNRIVWRDKFMNWHEHIVNEISTIHAEGKIYSSVYCENSINELLTDYLEELRPYNTTAYVALQRALSTSRWEVGTVNVSGTGSTNYYHISAKEAISKVIEEWGGELSTTITISGTGVESRKVNITTRRGRDNGKRFTWTKDMVDITRTVSADDVVTALYGYGKGLEAYDDSGNLTGGYERKLTFGDINGGKDYVTDEIAKAIWGLPDGKGGIKHTFGKVEFDDCEDKKELLALTKAELEKRCKPQVSYTANVLDLADAGFVYEDAQAGDTVALIDRDLDERLQGRVLSVQRYLYKEEATVIELGNITRTIVDVISQTQSSLGSLQARSGSWTSAAQANAAWLEHMMDNLNSEMNQTDGWAYWDKDNGITVYDKERDSNPTKVIQIKGGAFRIANSKKSNGDWDWRTFGDGDGFTADLINVGQLRCGDNIIDLTSGTVTFKNGVIQDLQSGNYWNLATGELRMASTITVGGKTVQQIADTAAQEAATKEVNDFISATYDKDIANLQAQIDGQIESFYYDYAPTLNNVPASGWKTETDRAKHEGDLFFNKTTGYAYRFFKDGNSWKWQLVQDTDITKALEAASQAQDTADNKRRVFVSQPTPPYDVGDLWTGGSKGDLKVCETGRASGSYVSGDWVLATKYTDDSALTAFMNGAYADTIKDIESQIDGKAETWYQTADPSSSWTTSTLKTEHKGDMWYNPSTNLCKRWSGTAWEDMEITPPQSVFDSIDGKAQIFIEQPKPPYHTGDLWFQSATSDILTCVKDRTSGNYTTSDWEKRNKYIDETAALTLAQEKIDGLSAEDVFNLLTDGGTIQGIYMKDGRLYVNATYLKTGTISSDGGAYWDLEDGEMFLYSILEVTRTTTNSSGTHRTCKAVWLELNSEYPFLLKQGTMTISNYNDGTVKITKSNSNLAGQLLADTFRYTTSAGAEMAHLVIPSIASPSMGSALSNPIRSIIDMGTGSTSASIEFMSISENTKNTLPGAVLYLYDNAFDLSLPALSARRGLVAKSNYVRLQFDSTHYVHVSATDCYFRCGSTGAGFKNGSWNSNITSF